MRPPVRSEAHPGDVLRPLRAQVAIAPNHGSSMRDRVDLVVELLDAPDPANIRAMRRANDMHRRRNIRWNVDAEALAPQVPDLTAHYSWPTTCTARWFPTEELLDDNRPFACTRRGGHTGRHAAGSGGLIVAVWA
jgi:hypothetical protein